MTRDTLPYLSPAGGRYGKVLFVYGLYGDRDNWTKPSLSFFPGKSHIWGPGRGRLQTIGGGAKAIFIYKELVRIDLIIYSTVVFTLALLYVHLPPATHYMVSHHIATMTNTMVTLKRGMMIMVMMVMMMMILFFSVELLFMR